MRRLEHRRDYRAGAHSSFEIALGHQLLQRKGNRVARDAEAPRELATREHAGCGRKKSGLDGCPQSAHELRAERLGGRSIEEERLEADWLLHFASHWLNTRGQSFRKIGSWRKGSACRCWGRRFS